MGSVVKFIGIDGCKLGWFYVGVIRSIREITAWLDAATLILVDIPIGLLTEGPAERLCDLEARQMIKPRGSTVFPAPARSALAKIAYEEGIKCAWDGTRVEAWMPKEAFAGDPQVQAYFDEQEDGRWIP